MKRFCCMAVFFVLAAVPSGVGSVAVILYDQQRAALPRSGELWDLLDLRHHGLD